MPSHNDFVDCLLSSGIISYEKLDEVEKKIGYEIENAPRKVLFCPDTNILYHNFLSSLEGIGPENVGVLTTVKDEIEASMNYKYSGSDIREIKDFASCQSGLLNKLSNRRKKKSRKAAYLAKREYKKFGGREISAVTRSTENKEKNDRTIAKSLKKYERENNLRTVLLTADTQMADICEMEGVDRFYLKYPESYSLNKCSHREFLKLLFDLSVIFGFIKLNSVLIFGEFGGKDPDESDKIKLKFLDEILYSKFRKHQEICKGLTALKISKWEKFVGLKVKRFYLPLNDNSIVGYEVILMSKYEGVVFPLYTEMIKKGVKDGKDVFAKFSRKDVTSEMDLYLYGSGDNGAKMIIAKAEVKATDSLKPNEVWEKYSERLFQNKEDFDDYTSNRRNKEMLVLELENLHLLDGPIEIPNGKNITVAGLYMDSEMKNKLQK